MNNNQECIPKKKFLSFSNNLEPKSKNLTRSPEKKGHYLWTSQNIWKRVLHSKYKKILNDTNESSQSIMMRNGLPEKRSTNSLFQNLKLTPWIQPKLSPRSIKAQTLSESKVEQPQNSTNNYQLYKTAKYLKNKPDNYLQQPWKMQNAL